MGARRPKRCDRCGSERLVPVLYGLPGPEAFAQAERGEIILGGCIVAPDQPHLECAECHATWAPESGWRDAPRAPEGGWRRAR